MAKLKILIIIAIFYIKKHPPFLGTTRTKMFFNGSTSNVDVLS